MNTVKHAGSCLCGQVRVSLKAEPVMAALCHCLHCQKTSSSAFSLVVLAKADDVTIEGDPASYTDRGDSGEEVMRLFCGKCGSPIETATAGTRAGGMRILKAGVFAEQAPFTPALEIYCFRRQDWLPQLSNSATFERMPPPST
jgi:hypothetical protein